MVRERRPLTVGRRIPSREAHGRGCREEEASTCYKSEKRLTREVAEAVWWRAGMGGVLLVHTLYIARSFASPSLLNPFSSSSPAFLFPLLPSLSPRRRSHVNTTGGRRRPVHLHALPAVRVYRHGRPVSVARRPPGGSVLPRTSQREQPRGGWWGAWRGRRFRTSGRSGGWPCSDVGGGGGERWSFSGTRGGGGGVRGDMCWRGYTCAMRRCVHQHAHELDQTRTVFQRRDVLPFLRTYDNDLITATMIVSLLICSTNL